ncbi:glycoside hydrolase family 130 protein [Pyrinomonas methylaliphatogenes]|jgi:predicted GH43/DUF377 family glycosyl hydrolase|uniref:Predicted glycosylase n=1 Tax=Pyrinomonas methylaliphatogenes TaxID=454194 RepID=A0A0B6WVD5_9BACT|nr:glycosidase [Pyrinomonas methylaliphatogenes]MBX5477495.1 glycosidase [Pyrinomonas methylaliphatogenes]CDM64244.1 predicted glycosylase [Pyrinomonas methylaliphatogenes]
MDRFRRHPQNPIITVDDLPFPAIGVYNPGVAEVKGEIVLLLRVEGVDGRSRLHVARSRDGIGSWRIDETPLLAPEDPESPYEELGCEDPRITYVEEIDEYVIAYVVVSSPGPGIALARTKDFRRASPIKMVLSPPNKNAALFPRRINGEWVMLHRPSSNGVAHIWIVRSKDLVYWGHPQLVLAERGGTWWDGARVGAGAVPIETPEGWLLIYHGVKMVAGTPNYRLGLALLDLDDPTRVIARCRHPAFSPNAPYERVGNGMNIVFTCGALLRGDEVWMYYGAADTCIGLATAKLNDLLEFARET